MCVDWRSLWIYLKIHVMLERKHEEIQISPRISSSSPDGGFSHMRHTLSTWCNLRRTISCFSFIENGPHGSVKETQQQHMQFMKINRKLLIGQRLTLPRNLFHRNRFFSVFFLWLKRQENLQFAWLLRFFTTCRAPWFRNDFSYSQQLKKKNYKINCVRDFQKNNNIIRLETFCESQIGRDTRHPLSTTLHTSVHTVLESREKWKTLSFELQSQELCKN